MRNIRKCQKGGDEVATLFEDSAFRAHHGFGENEISIELKSINNTIAVLRSLELYVVCW